MTVSMEIVAPEVVPRIRAAPVGVVARGHTADARRIVGDIMNDPASGFPQRRLGDALVRILCVRRGRAAIDDMNRPRWIGHIAICYPTDAPKAPRSTESIIGGVIA